MKHTAIRLISFDTNNGILEVIECAIPHRYWNKRQIKKYVKLSANCTRVKVEKIYNKTEG